VSTRIVPLRGLREILRHSDSLDRLAEESGSYFHTVDWLSAWTGVTAATDRVHGFLATDANGDTIGHLAMATLTRRLHRRLPVPLSYWGLAGSGYGAADHLGPIGSADCFGPLLSAALAAAPAGPVMLESVDPVHEQRLAELGFETVSRTSCPRIDLRGMEDERDLWPKKLLKEMRRRERRMSEEGISGRWIDSTPELLAALPSLQDVHLDRWRSKGGTGLFDGDRMELLHQLCAGDSVRSRPLMYVLEADGTTLASLLLLRCGSTMASYKSGWNPDLQAFSPGIAMHAAAIRRAAEEGRDTYDFLRGTSGHKYTLRAVDRFDVTMIRGTGVTTRVLRLRERDHG
jgi:CelD/BcsL family acetyltransferase involved in cellulose biosynthesis